MCKVSIIIPVYNAEDYLARCLDSVCNQTLKDIEIICVNDCSKDKSLEILNSYASKDKRIKVIDCKVNGGESVARNIGIDNATGEYLAFVDNDDVVDLDFYEKLYNEAAKTGADITKAEAKEIYYDGKICTRSVNKKIRETGCKAYFIGDWWTAIYKRDFINKNNIRLPGGIVLGGDLLFVNEAVIAANKVATIDGTYYYHLMREDSGDSKLLSLDKIKSVLYISEKIIYNINNIDINIIKEECYDHIYWNRLLESFFRAFRCANQESKELCARTTLNIYNQCKRKDILDKNIIKEHSSYLLPYLHNNNVEGLKFLFVQYSSLDKLRLAGLRMNIKEKYKKI